jgi:hypothetical protein
MMNQTELAPDSCAAAGLLNATRPALAGWYGDPMAAGATRTLLDAAQWQLQARLRHGGRLFPLHVLRMVCQYWTRSDSALEYQQLSALAAEDRERALVELVYGQLLISGKRVFAREHLARGFSLAVRHLDTPDYFLMVRRHELLAHLPLSGVAVLPQGLHALLAEAAVIRRLRNGERGAYAGVRRDTLG